MQSEWVIINNTPIMNDETTTILKQQQNIPTTPFSTPIDIVIEDASAVKTPPQVDADVDESFRETVFLPR